LFFCFPATAQKVGLVLSGGGARGAAHVGVIKALEENNIPIDYITGTSIGAIVGSLYAMGYTPDEMLKLILSDDFGHWQTGTVENEYIYYFKKPDETPQFMRFALNLKDSVVFDGLLPGSIVNPIQMNQAFIELYAQATAKSAWNFDNLFVPFRCIGADVYGKKAITFRNGDLGEAVRISMTFPFVFNPVWKDGVPLFDGGIYDNFPIKAMKDDFNPDFIFGSAVRGGGLKPSGNPMNQMEPLIMQKTEYEVPEEDGILLEMRLPNVSLLDFYKAREVMQIGYDRAMALIDTIKARVGREVPLEVVTARRKAYKESLPPLTFTNIYVTGVTEAQRHYITAQLTRDINGVFTMEDFRRAYFKMLTYSKIKEIIPSAIYNWKNKTFDLYLSVKIKEEIKVSIGGNISSHQANQLFLGLDYQSLGETSADYNANFQMGNSFSGVSLDGRFFPSARMPGYIGLKLAYSNKNYSQSQSLFYEDVVPAFIKKRERFIRARYGFPFLMRSKVEVFAGLGVLTDLYYQTSSFTDLEFDQSKYNLFNTGFRFEQNSLNYRQYPTKGRQQLLIAQYVSGNEQYRPGGQKYYSDIGKHEWFQVKGSWQKFTAGKNRFNIGFMCEAVYSTKKLSSNYTSTILRASTFAPTPHSKISFNEAFNADSYIAAGVAPVIKLNDMFHFRFEAYGFVPLREIQKDLNTPPENTLIRYRARYGDYFSSYQYMGEAALVLHLPFVSVSLFVNNYSYPKSNFNAGLNIGYLIFDSGFLD
jgi:NTE family protein